MRIVGVFALLAWAFGFPALVCAVYNAVATHFAWPLLTYWLTFGILFLLGVVSNAFGGGR